VGCQVRYAAVADEVLKHGGRLKVGRRSLWSEMQLQTLPAGPTETIKPSRSSKLEPFQKHLVVLSFREADFSGRIRSGRHRSPRSHWWEGGYHQESVILNAAALLAINSSECHASTNLLEDFGAARKRWTSKSMVSPVQRRPGAQKAARFLPGRGWPGAVKGPAILHAFKGIA
jgi:hypothetical protein